MISEVPRPQTEQQRYKKIKLLGQGSMGKVYLVECLADSQPYVIKRIQTQHLEQKQRLDLEKQAYLLQLLNHENIIRFKQIYTTKKLKLCIVMEYAEGGDLQKKIQEQEGKHFEQKVILNWLAQIVLGLKYMHERKIVHRDIKGANIFLTKDNVCKIGDFGISKIMNKTMETHKSFVGTPSYLSPEMVEGKAYNTKADIWALGVVLYQLCALKLPFEANSLAVLALRIIRGQFSPLPKNIYSKELQHLILSLLKVDPKKRPTASEILRNPLLRAYAPANEIVSEKSIPQKTVKLVNMNLSKDFQKGKEKEKSPRNVEKSPNRNLEKEKRDALRSQMKEDLKKKRMESRTSGEIKEKTKKGEISVIEPEETLPKVTVKPWKMSQRDKKLAEIPVQILLPSKREPKQTQPLESESDFQIEIKVSDKMKVRLEELEMEEQLEKSKVRGQEKQEEMEADEVEEQIEEREKGNQLQNVRNAIQSINLKLGVMNLPETITLNQYQDSLDNMDTILSSNNPKQHPQQDQCLKYITSNSSVSNTAEQLRILLEQKLGCSKLVRTYKTLKQYTQNLIRSNQELEFDKEKLRGYLMFLTREEFDSNLYSLYTLLVLENEDIRQNFDHFD